MLLPTFAGSLEHYSQLGEALTPRAPDVPFTRCALAAAHVVPDPLASRDASGGPLPIDWDSTLGFRRALWDQGFGLAEAMDTAQRGMGLDWESAKELTRRTLREARAHPLGPTVVCGAGTDQVRAENLASADAIYAAYAEQMETIEAAGGRVVLMASRALPAIGAAPDTYRRVYGRLIEQASEPVVLHWLGEQFDPALKGYWGGGTRREATDAVLAIIREHGAKVDGIKLSLLDREHEIDFRARLPENVKLYTGDDLNFVELMQGDGTRYSHALLGIFSAIAPAAAQALAALAGGDTKTYRALLAPTVPLAHEIFRPPTRFYKAGIAFISWLNGHQGHFIMPAGLQSSRTIAHYAQVFPPGGQGPVACPTRPGSTADDNAPAVAWDLLSFRRTACLNAFFSASGFRQVSTGCQHGKASCIASTVAIAKKLLRILFASEHVRKPGLLAGACQSDIIALCGPVVSGNGNLPRIDEAGCRIAKLRTMLVGRCLVRPRIVHWSASTAAREDARRMTGQACSRCRFS